MRKLRTTDYFAAMRIIRSADLREELKPVIKMGAEGKIDMTDLGIEGFLYLIEATGSPKVEKAFYDFISGPFECEPEDVAQMELTEFSECLKEFAEENSLKNFFDWLSNMITSKQ